MSSVDLPRTDEYPLSLNCDAPDMVSHLPVSVAFTERSRARPNNVDEGIGPAGALSMLSIVSFAVSKFFDKVDTGSLVLRMLYWAAPFFSPESIVVCVKVENDLCRSGCRDSLSWINELDSPP